MELGKDRRPRPAQQLRHALKGARLKSFHVDLDDIDTVDGRKKIIQFSHDCIARKGRSVLGDIVQFAVRSIGVRLDADNLVARSRGQRKYLDIVEMIRGGSGANQLHVLVGRLDRKHFALRAHQTGSQHRVEPDIRADVEHAHSRSDQLAERRDHIGLITELAGDRQTNIAIAAADEYLEIIDLNGKGCRVDAVAALDAILVGLQQALDQLLACQHAAPDQIAIAGKH